METGKLIAVKGPFDVEIREYPVPEEIEEGALLIKTEVAAICGSDGHEIRMSPEIPFCIGHEFVGRIVKMGKNANKFIHSYGGELNVGDRIVVYPHITCGKCDTCITHGDGICGVCDEDFCYGGPMSEGEPGTLNTNPEQYPHFKGGFGEYVYIFPNTYVWKIPEDMPAKVAVLLDPMAVAMRAVEMAMTEMGTLQEGLSTSTRALVIGAGPIGVMCGMILKRMGVDQLVIADKTDKKLETAKELTGADVILNNTGKSTEERVAEIKRVTDGGPHIVLQCASHRSATIEGLSAVRKLGTFIEVGMPMTFLGATEDSTINMADLLFSKNVRICGLVANSPKTFDRAFKLLMKYKELPFERFITHEFHTLEEFLPTMRKMRDIGYLKGVYVPE